MGAEGRVKKGKQAADTKGSLSAQAKALMSGVNLTMLRLVRAEAELLEFRESDTLGELKLEVLASGERAPDRPMTVRVFTGARAAYLPDATATRELVRMECHFALDYLVGDQALFEALTDETLQEFAGVNGMHNAWPYFREYFQNTLARMQLPCPPLPSFSMGRLQGGSGS